MRRRFSVVVAVLSVAGLVLSSCSLVGGGGGDELELTGVFSDGTGLYPSSPVRVRGVDVGEVTDIRTAGGRVQVDFTVDEEVPMPTDSMIVIIPLTLLGERYLQILPGDSPVEFEDGDTVPIEQTGKPAELDELLEGLEDFVAAIDEDAAGELLVNLAEVLEGNGSKLNSLIANGSQTIDLLADESDDLNSIVSALATLNETVAARSETIQELISNYNSLTTVLAANQELLAGTVENLDASLLELARLLVENQDELRDSVETLTQIGRTLDRNHENIADLLKFTVDLFAAADLAYDRENNWLPLNNHGDSATFSTFIADRLANRFAGICRRLAVIVGDPVPPDLVLCGEGDGTFFDPLLEQLPGLVDELMGSGASSADANDAATEATLLTGLAQILELVPDLPDDAIDELEAVSSRDDRILLDLIAQHAPEDLPRAVEEFLAELRAAQDSDSRVETTTTTLAPLPPPPVRRTLEEVDELLGDGS